jgi:hypothetical protein
MYRPYRASSIGLRLPRALPWADMLLPLRGEKRNFKTCASGWYGPVSRAWRGFPGGVRKKPSRRIGRSLPPESSFYGQSPGSKFEDPVSRCRRSEKHPICNPLGRPSTRSSGAIDPGRAQNPKKNSPLLRTLPIRSYRRRWRRRFTAVGRGEALRDRHAVGRGASGVVASGLGLSRRELNARELGFNSSQ